jgi:hypothetical protein
MYGSVCDRYYRAGISAIPVKGKKVCTPNFGTYSHRVPNRHERTLWKRDYSDYNIGLMLGPVNGIMAIDIDTNNQDVMDVVKDIAGDSPCAKFGSKGLTLFYKSNHMKNEMLMNLEHGCMLEFLCTSKQTVIPASIHPRTGEPYKWIGGEIIENINSLPSVDGFKLNKIFKYMKQTYDVMDLKKYRSIILSMKGVA